MNQETSANEQQSLVDGFVKTVLAHFGVLVLVHLNVGLVLSIVLLRRRLGVLLKPFKQVSPRIVVLNEPRFALRDARANFDDEVDQGFHPLIHLSLLTNHRCEKFFHPARKQLLDNRRLPRVKH
jgi:hypothetical protein